VTGRLTVWGASQLLMTYFTKSVDPPGEFYLALVCGIAPTPYMSGSELDEPKADDYSRVAIPNDLMNWINDSQPQEIYNMLPQQYITAISDWGQVRYWALCNAEVDGYNFAVGELETPVVIEAGDQVVFSEGDLSVALGPFFLAEEEE
jgi:hypothetical protein